MNLKNLEYLQDQVKFTGFGEAMANDIKTAIEQGDTDFKLKHETKYGNDNVSAELSFSKSKQSDMYFFNSYKVALEKEGTAQNLEQTFYINKGNNITLKEAYNLMEGRSVHKTLTNKEGEKYDTWIQMDFKQSDDNGNFKLKHYHDNYGYDLEAALSKHSIKELSNDDFKSDLIDSLKKGNLQSATFQKDGAEVKHFVEASPQYKTVNVYDGSMQKIGSRQSNAEKNSEALSQGEKQDGKKENQSTGDEDAPNSKKQASKRKNKQSI